MRRYGGSQLAFFLAHGDNYLARLPRTHAAHDIVIFDPRGLGASDPAQCSQPAHDPAIPEFPQRPGDLGRIVRHGASVHAHCLVTAGTGLVEQAADLEALRTALDTPRLDFLGQATGAELGTTYAALHPEHAGRIVLDTAVDPYLPPPRRVLDAARAEENAFGRFAAWCTPDNARCALAGQDVAQVYADVLAKGVPGLTGAEVRIAVGQFLLGYPVAWPGLAQSLADARDGRPSGLEAFVRITYAEPDYTGSRAQTCTDHPAGPADVRWLADRVRAAAPHTGGASLQWDALVSCVGWPKVPSIADRLPAHATPASPVLITATSGDPINPASWAAELRSHLSGARVLLSQVDGHGALDNAPCAAAAIDGYLSDGALPAAQECRD